MDLPDIKGIKFPGIAGIACRQLKKLEISQRSAHFPIKGIGLMIAEEGSHGDPFNHALKGIKPGIPLVGMLPVIHKVPHIHKKGHVRMVFKGLLSKGLPAAVISGLGIGKDKRRKRALCRRFKGHPGAAFPVVANAVFIACTGRKASHHGRMEMTRDSVISKDGRRGRDNLACLLPFFRISASALLSSSWDCHIKVRLVEGSWVMICRIS